MEFVRCQQTGLSWPYLGYNFVNRRELNLKLWPGFHLSKQKEKKKETYQRRSKEK